MKIRNVIAIAGTLALFSACIPSVNPFYTQKDILFDSRLLGEWSETGNPNEAQSWRFEKGDDKAYKLVVLEKNGKQGDFAAHLLKLREEFFLDLVATDCRFATNQADMVAASLFPGHLLVRVPQLQPSLKIAFFDYEWLAKYLKENPEALAHHTEGERILLTANTQELQQFVLQHLGEGELFQKPIEFRRGTNSVSTPTPPAR